MMQHRFDIYRSLAFGACAIVILCLAAVAGRAQEKYLMWSLAALTVASVLLVLF